jgi:hypothetical protein
VSHVIPCQYQLKQAESDDTMPFLYNHLQRPRPTLKVRRYTVDPTIALLRRKKIFQNVPWVSDGLREDQVMSFD